MEYSRVGLFIKYIATDRGEGDTKTNDCPKYVTFTIPGIPFWSFDYQSRFPGLMGVVGTAEDCWIYGFAQRSPKAPNQTLLLRREMLNSGLMSFHSDIEITIARSLYNHAVPIWPLKAKFCFGYLTGAFDTTYLELRAPHLPEPVVKQKVCSGYVDAQTRRAVDTLPQWYTDELNGKQVLQEGLRLDRHNPRPETAYRQSAMTLFSDIDRNKHTNYKTYIGQCINALQTAITIREISNQPNIGNGNGNINDISTSNEMGTAAPSKNDNQNHKQFLLRWMSSEIMKQGVKTMRAKFIKESHAGEEVDIYLWQEEGKPFWVFFSFERQKPGKKGSKILFELALEYFEPKPSL